MGGVCLGYSVTRCYGVYLEREFGDYGGFLGHFWRGGEEPLKKCSQPASWVGFQKKNFIAKYIGNSKKVVYLPLN